MLMQEAIAIVISPKYNEYKKKNFFFNKFHYIYLLRTTIFSLTPDVGIPILSTCKKSGFHEHVNNPSLYLVIIF